MLLGTWFNSGEFALFWRKLLYVVKYAFCVLFLGYNNHLCYFSRLFHVWVKGEERGEDGVKKRQTESDLKIMF